MTDFSQADLDHTNLADAHLFQATLTNSKLMMANLKQAHFDKANLRNAWLILSDAEGADFSGADLRGSGLQAVNLRDARFMRYDFDERRDEAILDETTILPDGTSYEPKSGLDQLSRFTDPQHPEFWQPDWVIIPIMR